MDKNNLISNTMARLFRLGETAGRIGITILKNLQNENQIDIKQITKVVENLSRLKGAPMKVGQMLSLHEDLLPPEIIEIFKILQKDSSSMKFPIVKEILQKELKSKYNDFAFIEEKPFASASIGQVHRAKLKNNEEVILKVQYPGIRKSIITDLKTLQLILNPLFKALSLPFDTVWEEIQDRLLEETNYRHELENLKLFHNTFKIENLILPKFYEEYTTEEILVLSYEESMPIDKTFSLKNLHENWLLLLLKLIIFGFYKYKILHVDPNIANFGFRKDGTVVLYDFGCIKKIPESISTAYKNTSIAILNNEWDKAGLYLKEAGIQTKMGEPLKKEFLQPHLEIIQEIFPDKETFFGEDAQLYKKLLDIARNNWTYARELDFPKDILFIHRNLIGHFGNLRKFRVKKNWKKVFLELVGQT
ncbi:MAG: ABC1 kinase family protein [Leptonema sp. (in: bacteria)]